ncbi:hypothetical protein SISSUDRAFT_1045452 [Sistotremastrum suecicum HHB10207 ss-3]|uniref:Uncharacterized protein n=1 Tax=Sistotremastrum suecicum HHB10207 ss-3 TaxID=1314776 RepID=A0A166EGY4_9AGAM|nr:hypothetical protein SISSUDRAFT_1045452 [Sistotremastrum suecicum HHB10207 ss-3]
MANFLEAFSVYYSYFLPALVAYALVSPTSLRNWLAVQETPVLVQIRSVEERDRRKWERRASLAITVVVGVVMLVLINLPRMGILIPGVVIDSWFGVFLGGVLAVAFFMTIYREFTWVRFMCRRDLDGDVKICEVPTDYLQDHGRLLVWSLMFSSAFISLAALLFDNGMAIVLLTISTVYMINLNPFPRMTMKRSIKFCMTLSTIYIVCGLMLFFRLPSQQPRSPYIQYASPIIDERPEWWAHNSLKWGGWVISMLWSILQGPLIALCYRYDFNNWIQDHPEKGSLLAQSLAVALLPENDPELSPGVLVPAKSLIPSFSKPYYTAVLCSWLVTHLITLLWIPIMDEGLRFAFAPIAGTLAMPVMCITILIVAWVRYEVSDLWEYREDWKITTTYLPDDEEARAALLHSS